MRIALLAVVLFSGILAQAQVAVVNGASFKGNQPVSPGSWAAAFGTFTGIANTQATIVPLPKTLAGVTVSIDGTDAPIYFVSAGQINFLIPVATLPGRRTVVVKTATATLNGLVNVVFGAPGIFVQDTAVPAKGAILNQDSSLNSSSNPIRRGEVFQVYATGPGPVSTPVADGTASPTSPLANTISIPQVFVDGVPAQLQFSGMAPGLIGVWQVNAFVPAKALGGRSIVQIFLDGVDSNEVGLFVQQ